MRYNLNSKGFAVSPFFIVALILLAVLLVIHFMSMDASKAKSIAEEGKLNKAILNLEEPKSSLKTLTLLSAHQAAYDAGQEGIPDEGALINKLREDIAADLANFNSYEDLAVTGTFTVEIEPGTEEERREGFMVSAAGKNVKAGGSDMSSALGAEKFTGARIFLLRDLSEDLDSEFKSSLADQLENCLIPEISCGGNPTSCWGDKMKLSAPANRNENDPCESYYGEPEAWTTWMEDPKKVADVLNRAVIHIERKASNREYFTYITGEDCAIKLETDEIKTSVRRKATGFCDCGHYVCVDRPEEDEDCGEDNCCEWKWVCDDYDSHVTLTITGTIKIKASIVDYSTLHEESKEKFEVCVNHPLILEDGETAPLEFKKDFPVDYRIVVKYTTDRSIGDFNKNPGPFHYSTPSYEFTNLEYTTDSKVCESGSSFEVDCEVSGGGDDGGGGEEDDEEGDGEEEEEVILIEISSETDAVGSVGTTDTVKITANAKNARGLSVSQYGLPGYLSFVSHSHAVVPGDDAKISTTYNCVKVGSNIPFKIAVGYRDTDGWHSIKEVTKFVTCNPGCSLTEIPSETDAVGSVGTTDTVKITVNAKNAVGLSVSQYGLPGYLSFVSHSHAVVPGDDAKISTTYNCVKVGSNIPFKIAVGYRDTDGWHSIKEVTKFVTCN